MAKSGSWYVLFGLLEALFAQESKPKIAAAVMICWATWKARNDLFGQVNNLLWRKLYRLLK